jgi:hypothetical protein
MSRNAISPLFDQPHRFDSLVQHALLRWMSKTLVGQPPSMRLRPSPPPFRIDPLVTQKKRTQLLAHDAHRPHGRLPRAYQIAHRLIRHISCA